MSCAPQSGAVSVNSPVQISVPLLAGPSVVTEVPFWVQTAGTGGGDPEQPGGLGQGTLYERARSSTKSPPTFVIEKVQVMVLPGDAEGGQLIVIPRPAGVPVQAKIRTIFWRPLPTCEFALRIVPPTRSQP
jgi:hypothetical protein